MSSADEAESAYRELLGSPGVPRTIGERARARVLEEHTFVHRARRLLDLVENQHADCRRLLRFSGNTSASGGGSASRVLRDAPQPE